METKTHTINNFERLATSALRKQALSIAEAGLEAATVRLVFAREVFVKPKQAQLFILGKKIELKKYKKVFCLGFDPLAKELASALAVALHPAITVEALAEARENFFGAEDMVIAVTAASPFSAENRSLDFLKSRGAPKQEIQTLAKHVGLGQNAGVKLFYPAHILNIILSGDMDHSPLSKDSSTMAEAGEILKKYNLLEVLSIPSLRLVETPKEPKYFEKTQNILFGAPKQVLQAMAEKAEDLGFDVKFFSDNFKATANELSAKVIMESKKGQCLLGESNPDMAVSILPLIKDSQVLLCLASGAVVDSASLARAKNLNLEPKIALGANGSFNFFEALGDVIEIQNPGPAVKVFFVFLNS